VLSGDQEARKLISIEKRSAQILAVLLLASLWFQSWAVSLGLILGGGIALLNFSLALEHFEPIRDGQEKYSLFQLIGKFFILLLVLFLVIRFARVNPVALVVGISTLVLGMVFEVIRQSLGKNRKGVW